jgi:hypothetical protein
MRWGIPDGAGGLGLCLVGGKADVGKEMVIEQHQAVALAVHGKGHFQAGPEAAGGASGIAGSAGEEHGNSPVSVMLFGITSRLLILMPDRGIFEKRMIMK